MKILSIFVFTFLIGTFTSATAIGETIWKDFRITYLQGNNYLVGDNKREIWTFEHASKSTWGDTFLFIDRTNSSEQGASTYGEFSPRIKVANFDGFIKALYIAPSVEMGTVNNYLYGIGTDLNLPYFHFFQFNFYLRNNGIGDNSEQITLSWGVPIGPLYYDGFVDYATGVTQTRIDGSTTKSARQLNFTSQLKYDIGPHFNLSNKLYIGIEYVFWNNKFGIDSSEQFRTDERNVNLLIKAHF